MVQRGQLISGLNQLNATTGISASSLRTALKRLKSTGEITVQPTNRYSMISICKYNDYQILGNENDRLNDTPHNKQTTNKQQTNDNKQEYKKNKEYTLESLRSLESLDNNKSLRAIVASRKKSVKRPILTDEEFLTAIKNNPAYKGIDIDRELGKMNAWFLTPRARKRKKTRAFIVNWLNKIDRPLTIQTVDKPSPAEVEKQIQKNIEAFNRREEAKNGNGF